MRWWQWLLSCPAPVNPASDMVGTNSSLNQHGQVWFLAGTFGEHCTPQRACTIPNDKSILFPIINYELNFLEHPEFTTESELITHVKKDEDDITNIVAKIDGKKLDACRIQSDPKIFYADLPAKNCLELPSRRIKIASDGYWVFLKPLSKGVHNIFFHASCSGGSRKCTAFYNLTII